MNPYAVPNEEDDPFSSSSLIVLIDSTLAKVGESVTMGCFVGLGVGARGCGVGLSGRRTGGGVGLLVRRVGLLVGAFPNPRADGGLEVSITIAEIGVSVSITDDSEGIGVDRLVGGGVTTTAVGAGVSTSTGAGVCTTASVGAGV